jgi:hypothetical protein
MVTARATDPESALGLLGVLGEADLDQVLSRRRAYGGSPEIFREILRTWDRRTSDPSLKELRRSTAGREILRDFLKRLLRRGAFVALDLLDGPSLASCLDELLDEALEANGTEVSMGAPRPLSNSGAVTPQVPDGRIPAAHFDDVCFKDLVVDLARLVKEENEVPDDELAAGLRRILGAEIPSKRERIVRRMAWVAAGFGFLEHDNDRGTWKLGKTTPAPDRRWGTWTMNRLRARASELLHADPDPFAVLVGDLFSGGRPSKLAGTIARIAIDEAREMTSYEA